VKNILISIILISLIGGCDNKSNKGVAKVHWDRDMCARCVMVISDRKNTVQIQNPLTNKTYMFDDIGCTILWFEDEHIKWKDKAKIWITDVNTGKWIDAKTAFYDTQNITPMAYGFSAHQTKNSIKPNQEIIDYKEVVRRVKKIGL
jgi:nitrous oxide reductase accessory protein NosL